ncbi:MAG: F0F1 ATP synthase assembly protein I [Alphaproteobacteria bacterium]|nr:F0F1 ATP synthase assembly protein I [Alphaproteobacteria bacterium]
MAENDPLPDDDRLDSLRRRVDAARAEQSSRSAPAKDSAASLALRFGGEFGAAVLVGAAMGFGADQFLPTKPWGLIFGLVLGFAAGVVNVVRVAQTYAKSHPVDPNAPRIADDEE